MPLFEVRHCYPDNNGEDNYTVECSDRAEAERELSSKRMENVKGTSTLIVNRCPVKWRWWHESRETRRTV